MGALSLKYGSAQVGSKGGVGQFKTLSMRDSIDARETRFSGECPFKTSSRLDVDYFRSGRSCLTFGLTAKPS